MAKIVSKIQGSPEWHQWRSFKIGASESAAILGISPYKTALQLFEDKILGQTDNPNYAMERGSRLEETARKWLNNLRPNHPPFTPICVEHDTIPWMIASLDGAVLNWIGGSEIKEACEIKLNGKEAHSMALNGEIVEWHRSQLQHQMVVANLQKITYVSFDGEEGVILEVNRDEEFITKKLMPALASFYQSLIDFKPPEASDKDVIEITNLDALKMAREYSEITHNIEELKKVQERLKEELCGMATHGRCKIGDLRVTKTMRKGAIDYSSIPELKSVSLDKYRKEPIISWRLTQN